MANTYIMKALGKPDLFSFNLEREFKCIDRKVLNNGRYSKRDLDKELHLLKQLAIDKIEIIKSKSITTQQLKHNEEAIIEGAENEQSNSNAASSTTLPAFQMSIGNDGLGQSSATKVTTTSKLSSTT